MDKTTDSVEDTLHLCYKNEVIGIVTHNHRGMGWYSTRFLPTIAYGMLKIFVNDLRTAEPDRMEELKLRYKDLMKPEFWTMADGKGKDIYRMSTIPKFINQDGYVSAKWQGKFIDDEEE